MNFNTKFGNTIYISLEDYLDMTDDELAKREEDAGATSKCFDPLQVPIGLPINTEDIEEE